MFRLVSLITCALFVGLTPSVVSAQCHVTVDAVPEVRDAVAEWSRGQLHCNVGLVASVTQEEASWHVVAHDASGRHWERTVDAARTAAALIVSWAVADESVAAAVPKPSVAPVVSDSSPPSSASAWTVGAALSAATTSNILHDVSNTFGYGGQAEILVGKRWWRVGVAYSLLQPTLQRSEERVRTITLRVAAELPAGGVRLQYLAGIGEQVHAGPYAYGTVNEAIASAGAAVALPVRASLALRFELGITVPLRASLQRSDIMPIATAGVAWQP